MNFQRFRGPLTASLPCHPSRHSKWGTMRGRGWGQDGQGELFNLVLVAGTWH